MLVAEYSIIWRLGATFASLIGLGTGAFVPAFREAHERGDSGWMKAAFRRMLLLRMSMTAAVALTLIFGGNFILRFWLHRGDFEFPPSVWIAQSVVFAIAVWTTAFMDFLTIMDRIWIQVALVVINGIRNNRSNGGSSSDMGAAGGLRRDRSFYRANSNLARAPLGQSLFLL